MSTKTFKTFIPIESTIEFNNKKKGKTMESKSVHYFPLETLL